MNRLGLLAAFVLVIAAGCAKPGETTVVGADGSRVTTSQDGTKGTAVGEDGTKVEWEANNQDGLKGNIKGSDGKNTSYEMGGSTTLTEGDMGFAFYPGATKRDKDMDVKANADGKVTMMATRFTADDVKKVFDFYAGQGWAKTKAFANDSGAVSGENDKGTVGITVTKGDGGTLIAMTVQSK